MTNPTQPNSDTNEPMNIKDAVNELLGKNHDLVVETILKTATVTAVDNEPMTVEQLLLSAYYRGKDKKAYSDAELKADTTQINALIRKVCEEVIGEDEDIDSRHETTDEGAYEWSYNVRAASRNEYRAEQRNRLQQLLQKGASDG